MQRNRHLAPGASQGRRGSPGHDEVGRWRWKGHGPALLASSGSSVQSREMTKLLTWLVAVLAVSSVLVAACGGSPAHNGVASLGKAKTTTGQSGAAAASGSSGQSGPTESLAQALKYSECMQSHGINMPDPQPLAGGGYDFRPQNLDFGPGSPQLQSADKACEKYLGPGSINQTPAEMMASAAKWVKCLRSHGEPDFPEPNSGGVIEVSMTATMSPNSPQLQKASMACNTLFNNSTFSIEWNS